MSDELPVRNDLPSADDLDAYAREQELAELAKPQSSGDEAIVNNVNSSFCVTCNEPSVRICSHCGQFFCSRHHCLTHELATANEPLIDDEGVERRGRRIHLIGEGWPNEILRVAELSDSELELSIRDLQERLKEAIRTQDYTRISLAAHEFERDYRAHSRYVAAVKRREKIQQGSIKLNSKKHKVGDQKDIPADVAALMKLGNLTYEAALAMKTLLASAKKA